MFEFIIVFCRDLTTMIVPQNQCFYWRARSKLSVKIRESNVGLNDATDGSDDEPEDLNGVQNRTLELSLGRSWQSWTTAKVLQVIRVIHS